MLSKENFPGKKQLYSLNPQDMFSYLQILNSAISIGFSSSVFLTIPFATLWDSQLVMSLSNDISETPGPQYTIHNEWGFILLFIL